MNSSPLSFDSLRVRLHRLRSFGRWRWRWRCVLEDHAARDRIMLGVVLLVHIKILVPVLLIVLSERIASLDHPVGVKGNQPKLVEIVLRCLPFWESNPNAGDA